MFEYGQRGLGDLGFSTGDITSGFKKIANIFNPVNLPKTIIQQVTKNRPTISVSSAIKLNKSIGKSLINAATIKRPTISFANAVQMNKNIGKSIADAATFKKPALLTLLNKPKKAGS